MMDDDAEYFVRCIGEGIAEAFNTCRFFLGVESETFKNTNIHPEYVTTVEVAKKLTGFDRHVSLETHMKDLRREAGGLARLSSLNDQKRWAEIADLLKKYRFGEKDSRRIDIVVRPSSEDRPPLLLAEAKLGISNVAGVIQDIDRVTCLLTMYHRLGLLDRYRIYGAILFHSAKEGGGEEAAALAAQNLLTTVETHLSSVKATYPWLLAKAGILSAKAQHQPVQAYWEQFGEGEGEGEFVFAKTSLTFAPGLILLGNGEDVETVAI